MLSAGESAEGSQVKIGGAWPSALGYHTHTESTQKRVLP